MGGLSSFCITIPSDFCCLVSGISHTEGNPSGISSTQAYSRKIVPICFLFQRRIRWRRAFFQLGRGKIKSWEGLRGGIRRTRSNSPVSNRDFLVPTGFTSSLLPLDRQWESRMMVKKENKKGGKMLRELVSRANVMENWMKVSAFIYFILGTTSLEKFERFD